MKVQPPFGGGWCGYSCPYYSPHNESHLKIVFVLLSRQVPYRDSTVDYQALVVKRNAPRWIGQLKKFGYLLKTA